MAVAGKAPKKINVDPFSRLAVRLTMYRDDLELATGSGCLWRLPDRIALVTAWHCLTGAHPETRQPLSPKTAARPNKVCVRLLMNDFGIGEFMIDLYDADDNPNWYVHPLGFREVDLAAVFFDAELPAGCAALFANEIRTTAHRVTLGADLFIVGFPNNLHRMGLPIWKRASLALELDATLDQTGLRHFLVDTASRKGMSGAIVISRSMGRYTQPEGGWIVGVDATQLMGIYTGRIGADDELEAQLGMVWPMRYVNELFASPRLDDFV